MSLKLMYITNNPDVAVIAQRYGVDRIWIDIETLGKEERQKDMNSVKSNHKIEDIEKIVPVLNQSDLLVRVNPWNKNSKEEINRVIAAGADIIMLPMWKTVREVEGFLTEVAGRVQTSLLLETKEAENCLDDVLKLNGIDEIHIGLNDLHLSYGLNFMFELLSNGTIDRICKKLAEVGMPYGFGGVARIGEGIIPAEKVILEHYRLKSTRAILSRSFCNVDEYSNVYEVDDVFREHVKKLRMFEDVALKADMETLMKNHQEVVTIVDCIADSKRRT